MKHSVVLEDSRCRGCTTCIKVCPTEAIRVRAGKATILNERCIDCGRCIQVCPCKAIKSVSDPLDKLRQYKYTIALPNPVLYGQFHNITKIDTILNGLLQLGFDQVYETARAGEILSHYIQGRRERALPQISSACPAILRLICLRFPKLIPNVTPLTTPTELAAILARRGAVETTGLRPEEIGVFAIVPCSSQVTNAQAPMGLSAPVVDGALSIRDIYLRLLNVMGDLSQLQPLTTTGAVGIGRAFSGGEIGHRSDPRYLSVDGMENVITILEAIEDGRVPEADFIELFTCAQGCVGGCLTVENPYSAKMRLKALMNQLPLTCNKYDPLRHGDDVLFQKEMEYHPALLLDEERGAAMEKMQKVETLVRKLPGLDCSTCGAPSCRALAEDVVLGWASEEDCIFRMREKMQRITGGGDTDAYLPAPFRRHKLKGKKLPIIHGNGGGGL